MNNDNSGRPQFFPWMCIDPVTGVMYIVYYDRRNTIGTMTEVYVARYVDGGKTFHHYLVSDKAFETNNDEFLGDYINIIAYNGKAYPVWTQTNQFGRNIVIAKIDESTLDVKDHKIITTSTLYQNYPNPFNPGTKISYKISEKSFVSLKIYDILGNEIMILVNEEKPAGFYEKEFNAAELSSGIYFYN